MFPDSLVRLSLRHPGRILLFWVAFALISIAALLKSHIESDITKLLPGDDPHVQMLRRISSELGGEVYFEVALQSESFDRNRQLLPLFAEQALQLKTAGGQPYFTKYEFKNNTGYIQDHFLYFLTHRELSDLESYLDTVVIDIKKNINPFFEELDEEAGEETYGRINDEVDGLKNHLGLPPPYYRNGDGTTVLLKLFPSGSKSDLAYVESLFAAVKQFSDSLHNAPDWSGVTITFGGELEANRKSVNYVQQMLNRSTAISIGSIVLYLLLHLFFVLNIRLAVASGVRGWSVLVLKMLLVLFAPLALSVVITMASGSVLLGGISILSLVLIAILFGVNIDYSLHLFSVFMAERGNRDAQEAALTSAKSLQRPLLLSAATTVFAFLVLLLSDFSGFREFGFLAAVGVGVNYLITQSFNVALMVKLFAHDRVVFAGITEAESTAKAKAKPSRLRFAPAVLITALAIGGVVLLPSLQFQYGMDKLEPNFGPLKGFDKVSSGVDRGYRGDATYFLFDNEADAREAASVIRSKPGGKYSTVGHVECIHERVPIDSADAVEKLAHIAKIRTKMQDKYLAAADEPGLNAIRIASQQTEPIPLDSLPPFYRNKFITRKGELAPLVIIYPKQNLHYGRNSIDYKEDASEVTLSDGRRFYAASTSIIAATILETIKTETARVMFWPLVALFGILLVLNRRILPALAMFVPLLLGLCVLICIWVLTGQTIHVYNAIVIPALFGVGADVNIHLVSAVRAGETSWRSLYSNSIRHILACNFTTIFGFWGLIFINYPGLESLGWLAVTGYLANLVSGIAAVPVFFWMKERALL
jgi:predicted RND superfamily exporter protein